MRTKKCGRRDSGHYDVMLRYVEGESGELKRV